MSFVVVCIIALAGLGIVAGIASCFDKGEDTIVTGHDCAACSSADDGSCKLHCLLEEKKEKESEG